MKRREKTTYVILKPLNLVKGIKELGGWKLRKGRFLERVGVLSVPSHLQGGGVRMHLLSSESKREAPWR